MNMKASVLTDWEKLEMLEVPKPKPKKDEVLIRVLYGGVCGSDITVFHHRHLTATVPRIMCHEILGIVEEINCDSALPYQMGDRVVVHPLRNCGTCEPCMRGEFHVCGDLQIMGLHMDGGFAEYVCAEVQRVFKVSDDIPDKAAILTEPLAVGFHACDRAGLAPGEEVLVIGGGPIGIMTAATARYFGASKVVVAELNQQRLEFIRSLGFETIDSGREDLVKRAEELTRGQGFDKVFETSGSNPGAQVLASVTRIRGKAVLVGIPSVYREYQTNKLVLREVELLGSRVHTLKNFERAVEMMERMYRANSFELLQMISGEYPLEELERALKVHESGTEPGKLIVKIGV